MAKNIDRSSNYLCYKAILDTARYLESHGTRVTYLPVDESVDPIDISDAITDETVMISVMFANNGNCILEKLEK